MKKRKVLIVDDERGFTRMVKLNLEAAGDYEVRIVNEPANTIHAALEFKPDVVLLDIIMPDIEGPDVVCQLKNTEGLKNVPVIFLTANITRQEVENQQGMIGGHAFLAKPGTIKELIACIEKQFKPA